MHNGTPYAVGREMLALAGGGRRVRVSTQGEIALLEIAIPDGARNHLSNRISNWEMNEKAHRIRFGRHPRAQQVVARATDCGAAADLLSTSK